METLAYLLPALGCAAMMGAMMWMMRRRPDDSEPQHSTHTEVEALREEIAALRRDSPEATPTPDE